MDDEQLRKHAELEDKYSATVISPNLLQQIKPKQQFFYVVLQDDSGKIVDITHHSDYDTALLRGMEKAKEFGAQWSTFDFNGRFIDGGFKPHE